MLTKETIEQAIPFIEESWWLMCDSDQKDWELKNPVPFVFKRSGETLEIVFAFDSGELRFPKPEENPKQTSGIGFTISSSESPRKLVKEVHDAMEHIMKEPYDYYLEED